MLQKHFMLQKHTKPICEICSKITISTLNRFHTFIWYFYYQSSARKSRPDNWCWAALQLTVKFGLSPSQFVFFVCLFVFCLVDKDNQTMKCGQLIVNRVEQKKYFSLRFMPKMSPGDQLQTPFCFFNKALQKVKTIDLQLCFNIF